MVLNRQECLDSLKPTHSNLLPILSFTKSWFGHALWVRIGIERLQSILTHLQLAKKLSFALIGAKVERGQSEPDVRGWKTASNSRHHNQLVPWLAWNYIHWSFLDPNLPIATTIDQPRYNYGSSILHPNLFGTPTIGWRDSTSVWSPLRPVFDIFIDLVTLFSSLMQTDRHAEEFLQFE